MIIAKGCWSPCGEIQSVNTVAPGIMRVTTAAHGGLFLDEMALALMPVCMQRNWGWCEEDQEWVFEKELREIRSDSDRTMLDSGIHLKILATEWPKELEDWRSGHAA